jgi:hypothetical protein
VRLLAARRPPHAWFSLKNQETMQGGVQWYLVLVGQGCGEREESYRRERAFI